MSPVVAALPKGWYEVKSPSVPRLTAKGYYNAVVVPEPGHRNQPAGLASPRDPRRRKVHTLSTFLSTGFLFISGDFQDSRCMDYEEGSLMAEDLFGREDIQGSR